MVPHPKRPGRKHPWRNDAKLSRHRVRHEVKTRIPYRTYDEFDPGVVYWSTGELAERTGMCRASINNKIRSGEIPAVRRAKKSFIHPDVADEVIKRYT